MKTIVPYMLIIALISSCSDDYKGLRKAKGDRYYGGNIHYNEIEQFTTLFPHTIADVSSTNISMQLFEGLVKLNSKNITEVLPSIAESWTINENGTEYTFKIRKGVFFHDDPCFKNGKGREVNAGDVLFSFEKLCTYSETNIAFNYTLKNKLKGGNEYYEASKKGNPSFSFEGVKVIDDYTVKIILESPNLSFLYVLSNIGCSILPKEGVAKYGNLLSIGTGPFKTSYKPGKIEKLVLVRNDNYYISDSLGNKLPYLDSITVTFINNKYQELEMFKKSEIDFITNIPSEAVNDIVAQNIKDFKSNPPKYFLDRTPELHTYYYEFNMRKKPFTNIDVRKAFCYAINKEKIVEHVLKGEAYGPGNYGFCPQSFIGYDITHLKGYKFNPDSAKYYLNKAGYPDGKNFPTITLEVTPGTNTIKVAEEIKQQLESTLNINIQYNIIPLSEKTINSLEGKTADLYRTGWVADYPSPESMLNVFYGKLIPENDTSTKGVYPNSTRFKNEQFDFYYEKGVTAKTKKESYENFIKAEEVLLKECPVLLLYYGESLKLAQNYVKNFSFNPMTLYYFNEVYIDPAEKYKKAPDGSVDKK